MLGLQQQLADIVMADPAVAGIGSVLGGGGGPGGGTSNRGTMFITLKPPAEREGITTALAIDRLRKNLFRVAGIRLFMFAAQDVRAGGRQSDSDYQYTLSSTDLELLQKWAPIVGKRMETVEGITDVSSDRDPGGLQLTLSIDRKTASSLGVRVQDIDNALNNAFSQRQISIVYTQRNQYMVVLEIDPKFQSDPSNLERIFVAGANGAQVPLSAVVHYKRDLSALAVFHSQSFPSTTVSFNLMPDVPLEVATTNIQRAVEELHMPEGIRGSFDGNAGDFNKTSGRQPLLILGALVAMYIVLGVLYESLAHPLTIISTLPSAGLGALLALQITNTPLTVIAFIGIILLIGIVKKNGIMMVDFALDAERQPRTVVGRGHFRGLQRPVPADPDDDDGGPVRRHSAGARDRPRHRAAPSARHHHHRRPVRLADPDAVHDAGDLPADRPAAAAIRAENGRGTGGISASALLKRMRGKRIAGRCRNNPKLTPAPRRRSRNARTVSNRCRCASATASRRSKAGSRC